MIKKAAVLVIALTLFFVPAVSFAKIYQNREYDFQIDLPDGFSQLAQKETSGANLLEREYYKEDKTGYAYFNFGVAPAKEFGFEDTFADATNDERKYILNEFIAVMKEKFPGCQVIKAEVEKVGVIDAVIIQLKLKDNKARAVFVSFLNNQMIFNSMFLTDNPEGYNKEYFDMLKSFKRLNE